MDSRQLKIHTININNHDKLYKIINILTLLFISHRTFYNSSGYTYPISSVLICVYAKRVKQHIFEENVTYLSKFLRQFFRPVKRDRRGNPVGFNIECVTMIFRVEMSNMFVMLQFVNCFCLKTEHTCSNWIQNKNAHFSTLKTTH